VTTAVEAARRRLRDELGARVRTDVPMAPFTTFRIGGPAAIYLQADGDADLDALDAVVAETAVAVAVIGKGSNLLVADEGFDGVVLRLGRGFRWIGRDGDVVTAGGATPLPALAGEAQRHGLDGLAFGVAIPASLGGAVRMNAGAHGGEMAGIVERVDGIVLGTGGRRSWPAPEVGFAYRRTGLPEGTVVTGAALRLRSGDRTAIRAEMDEARRWRRETQPLAEPNCGSVFTNPPGGHAASLIEDAGLKGASVGGAEVSRKHANFIVARPGATAADVVALIDVIRRAVADATGIELQTEVRTIGGAVRGA
jgi:UDP-N-acetylmuramate dehydrogenase